MSKDKYPNIFLLQMEAIVVVILQISFVTRAVLEIGGYLTIILRNRAEYRLLLSRRGQTKLVTFLNLSVDIFSLHFFFPRTKLRISSDICYLRMTDIESIMTIFG